MTAFIAVWCCLLLCSLTPLLCVFISTHTQTQTHTEWSWAETGSRRQCIVWHRLLWLFLFKSAGFMQMPSVTQGGDRWIWFLSLITRVCVRVYVGAWQTYQKLVRNLSWILLDVHKNIEADQPIFFVYIQDCMLKDRAFFKFYFNGFMSATAVATGIMFSGYPILMNAISQE